MNERSDIEAAETAPANAASPRNVHASVVSVGGEGILIRGRSRSGKSALALSLLRRAELLGIESALVGDDQVFLERKGNSLFAVAPATIRGLIEVSGIGIIEERFVDRAKVTLVVDLLEHEAIARMPATATETLHGVSLRRIVLPERQASFGADVLQGLAMRSTHRKTP
ncbi:MAG: HPr kinase/phosphatase C-terminal domain-containing protein [Rhizobiaceae bacterium]|nr:HPr kinase/phosphatase C-terminal domain-containing protein [Rhizobiaceae bacterium]